jgi:hypothetical protein
VEELKSQVAARVKKEEKERRGGSAGQKRLETFHGTVFPMGRGRGV